MVGSKGLPGPPPRRSGGAAASSLPPPAYPAAPITGTSPPATGGRDKPRIASRGVTSTFSPLSPVLLLDLARLFCARCLIPLPAIGNVEDCFFEIVARWGFPAIFPSTPGWVF